VFCLFADGSIESPSQSGNLNYWEQPFSQPYFDNATRRDVTSTVGQMTYLHCRVRNLGDRSVSHFATLHYGAVYAATVSYRSRMNADAVVCPRKSGAPRVMYVCVWACVCASVARCAVSID